MSAVHPRTPSTPGIVCFFVVAHPEPEVMARILQVFAKRGLLPHRWYSAVDADRGQELHVDVQIAGLDRTQGERLASSLRQLVDVKTVLTSERRQALTA